jgi:hypothetical protein
MAKIHSQTLVITISKMVRDSEPETAVLDAETVAQLEAVVTELAGSGVIVEVEQA